MYGRRQLLPGSKSRRRVVFPGCREDGRCPVSPSPQMQLRLVEPVDPVLSTDLLGQGPADDQLSEELDGAGLRLYGGDQMDDDVPSRPVQPVQSVARAH
jgi:hypothetical protein